MSGFLTDEYVQQVVAKALSALWSWAGIAQWVFGPYVSKQHLPAAAALETDQRDECVPRH